MKIYWNIASLAKNRLDIIILKVPYQIPYQIPYSLWGHGCLLGPSECLPVAFWVPPGCLLDAPWFRLDGASYNLPD